MQLLRLELRGFKSFADKTSVHFSPGMTSIVGPNGSGKSNITDAIRWVLGESNVRNLRGQKAEDIIFSGTEKRRPMSSAEVTLVFDNSDKQLADELGEVAISRRVYRNGDSEFYINKRSCRLKDIHHLLADTGLGRDSMAIIGQNKVDAILNSKPDERRLIFEDVAGISRFKMNKEDALRRMAATEHNMERVSDLLATLQEQLIVMEEKAKQTRTYNELAKEKRLYDGALTFHAYKTAERMQTRLENENIALLDESTELEETIAANDALRLRLTTENEARQEELKTIEQSYSETTGKIEKNKGKINLLEEQQRSLMQSLNDKRDRLQEIEATIQADKNKIILLEKTLDEDKAVFQEDDVILKKKEEIFKNALDAHGAGKENWENSEKGLRRIQERRAQIQGAREGVKAELSLIEKQAHDKESLGSVLAEEIAEAIRELESLTSLLDDMKASYDVDFVKCVNLQEAQKKEVEESNRLEKRMNDNKRRQLAVEGRLEILANWAEEHEGFLEPTKAIMKAKVPWSSQMRGPVGSLFTVDKKYITAIDVALGGTIHHIICDTSQSASAAIDYLKVQKKGRATFLPLDAVKGRSSDEAPLKEEGILGRAVDCITFDKANESVFSYLLGRTLVAATLEEAIKVQKKFNRTLRIVTLEGELLQAGGSLTGGSLKRSRGHLMSRKGEEITLQEELSKLRKEYETLEESFRCVHVRRDDLALQINALHESLEKQQRLVTKQEGQTLASKERYERKLRVEGEVKEEIARFMNRKKELKDQLESFHTEWEDLEKEATSLNDLAISLDTLTALQQAMQVAHEEYTKIRLLQEQRQEGMKHKEETLEEYRGNLKANENRLGPLSDEISKGEEALDKGLPGEILLLREALRTWEEKEQRLKEKRNEIYEINKKDVKAQDEARQESEVLRQRQSDVSRKLIDMEGRLTKIRLNSEQALQDLTSLGFSKEEGQALELPGKVQDWQNRQNELLAQMEALGIINPNAIVEYEESLERNSFLERQLGDLQEAKAQLEDVISKIDKDMSQRFLEVFSVVSERFQDIFSQLFGGGQAQLTLTKKDNILESGIDMYIQPPGKKLQQLSLLSGGERALTVIALLFAFMGYRPAPFCVLDEVDAPLDEANVERFGRYLHNLCQKTQFIVVTHRKKTMEAAQVLQGVTMVEQGVSQMLTVSFEDVEEDAV